MSHNAADIEAIVRQVLSTLLAGDAARVTQQPTPETQHPESGVLTLDDNVISLNLVRGKLDGFQQLLLSKAAVLTPAARDYLRENKVTVKRTGTAVSPATVAPTAVTLASILNPETSTQRPQRLIVAGAHRSIDAISKQLCPKQASVLSRSVDDTAALHAMAEGLRRGHQAGVLVANAPHATCWQAARDDKLRPVVVTQWNDLGNACREVPLNVLIVPAAQWTVPAICNAARKLFEHLQRT